MVHMDLHGIVKFPADYINEILERAKKLLKNEADRALMFRDPKFSLKRWKLKVGGYTTV